MAGFENPGAEFWRTWHGPYLGFKEVHSSIGHTTNTHPNQHYRLFLDNHEADWKGWFPMARGQPLPTNATGCWNIPAPYHDTEWVTQMAERFIDERLNESTTPWFCWVSYQDPHEPMVCPEPWYSSVDTSQLTIFEGKREGEFDDKPDIYEELTALDAASSKYNTDGLGIPCAYTKPFSDAEQRQALQATLGMISFIDHGVGRILKRLESSQQLDNTLIVFTSDHGEYHGHHGFWGKGLPAYEDAQRVPLLARGPGIKRGRTCNSVVSLVDLPRTFLRIAGVAIPQGMQGSDLRPLFSGEVQSWDNEAMIECRPNENGIYQQTFISGFYKLVVYREFESGELYDLQADPDQYVNLWSCPQYKDLKLDLLARFVRFNLRKDGQVHPRTAFA